MTSLKILQLPKKYFRKCPILMQQADISTKKTFEDKSITIVDRRERNYLKNKAPSLSLMKQTYCNIASERKRPRLDRVGYQHEKKFSDIQNLIGNNFNTEGFFNGVAESFLVITNLLNEGNYTDLQRLMSDGAYYYTEWLREESVHNVTAYNEVIFPVVEKDIFSLVVNNIDIDRDEESSLQTDRETTFYIKVTVTYGKNHRVIFGIPDSYSCSFAVFVFKRTLTNDDAQGEWLVDRLQYYPPR